MILGDDTYYVSSSVGTNCPQPCHPLSYYINDTATYFTSNATFIFMEGEHLLDHVELAQVAINNVDSLTLKGKRGQFNADIVITCTNNTHGLAFNEGNHINIYDISITGCGHDNISPLQFSNVATLNIASMVVHRNVHGLLIYNTYNIIAINSVFCHNNDTFGGGLHIYSSAGANNIITISNSLFANNNITYHGGGLYIYYTTDTSNTITITNSTFVNNSINGAGGGLYMYSYTKGTGGMVRLTRLTISNSIFINNIVNDNGGGLFIDSDVSYTSIVDSIFTRNTVNNNGGGLLVHTTTAYKKAQLIISNSIFASNQVSGTGGGLVIYSTNNYPIDGFIYDINITCSKFNNNNIHNSGGGLLLSTVTDKYGTLTVADSIFSDNNASNGDGGGLYIISNIEHVNINNSTFTGNNIKDDGGGLYMHSVYGDSIQVAISYSNFSKNKAGGIGSGFVLYTFSETYLNMANCIVANNNGSGLKLLTDSHIDVLLSKVVISTNNGHGIGTNGMFKVIFTQGHSIVANNSSPTDGGGIYLDYRSSTTVSNGGHVHFINNSAKRYGGAIYSPDNDYRLFARGHITNEQSTVYHLLADSATFINNTAIKAGDVLYGGMYLRYAKLPTDYVQYVLKCPSVPGVIRNATSLHSLSTVSSDPLIVCPCVNGDINCSIRSLDRVVYPGQMFHISLVIVGLCSGVSPGLLMVKHNDKVHLISSAATDYAFNYCTALNYTVRLTTYITSKTTFTIDVAEGDSYGNIGQIDVHLTILACPLGLVLDSTLGSCVCSDNISHLPGVACNVSWIPYPIQRSGDNWISRYHNHNCTIAHIGCPFDYCNISSIKLSLNESDLQCNNNRSGILCGQCQPGLSLLIGSNKCHNCTDTALIAVSVFIITAIAGIILVIFLMALNLTVSVGSINGLLFYANIVKLNEAVFFPQGNVPVISQFIAWWNLDLGIEYCFIEGLDGYIKTWLQFVFPLYIWVLVLAIIVACRYSGRLSRLTGHNAVPVLATLILMSYTKLLRTITDALMINTIQCGEYKWIVWNVDSNIDYFSVKHIALFAVALLFLLAGIVYTLLVLTSQCLQNYSGYCFRSTRDPVVILKPFIDAYTGPFKDRYRFWTGLGLKVRLMLTVIFSITTTLYYNLNNYIILIVVGFILSTIIGTKVYKNNFLTALEMLSYANLMSLSLMTILFTESYHSIMSINVIVSVSVSFEIFLFLLIVTVHCFVVIKKAHVFPACCSSVCVDKGAFRIHQLQRLISTGGVKSEHCSQVFDAEFREELLLADD